MEKILNFRLIYFAEGGREMLEQDRCIQISQDLTQFEEICQKWEQHVLTWQEQVNEQRKKYPVLSFFTVNDMRFIFQQINYYHQHKRDMELNILFTKLSFINNNNISIDDIKSLVTSKDTEKLLQNGNFNGGKLELLGKALKKCLKDKIGRIEKLPLDKEFENKILFDKGRPYLYHCERQSEVLDTVLKLFILQNQIPSPSRVLFCNELTTQETLECFLQRLKIKTKHQISVLHCLVQPENLSLKIKEKFVDILQKYMYGEEGLLAIVMCDKKDRIFNQLMSYYATRLALTQYDRIQFFQIILQKDWDTFCESNDKININKPFCGVFLSQRECVGKSYVIQKMARDAKCPLIHIPIMTQTVDYTFVISKLIESHNHPNSKRILYHIDVSSDAGFDLNELFIVI